MRIYSIDNRQTSFKSYYPLSEEEIYHNFGKYRGKYIDQAMTDLVPIAHIDATGLDVMVKTIENENVSKRGIIIAVADEKSEMPLDFLSFGKTKNHPHIKGSIYLDDVLKLETWSKVVCDTAKSLIETFKICRKNPRLFDYFNKIYK